MAEENRLTSPDTSMYPRFQPMPQADPMGQVNKLIELQRNDTGLQQQQLDLGMKRLGFANDQLSSLMAKVDPQTGKPNATFQDVTDMIGNLIRAGAPADHMTQELQQWQGLNSAQIQDRAKQKLAAVTDHATRLGMAYGVPGTLNLGDIQQPVSRNMVTNEVRRAGQGLTQGQSPEFKASRVDFLQDGVMKSAPQSSLGTREGYALPPAPQANAGAAANMAPRGVDVPGALQSRQAPGIEAAANTSAASDAKRATDFEDAVNKVQDTRAILDRMDMNAVNFTGGPASPLLKKLGGWVNQGAGIIGAPKPIESQAAREAFDKDAAWLAGQQSSILGNTDAAKSLASVMTPGSSNSNEGIRNIAAVLKGNQDAIEAKGQAWNAYKNALPSGVARLSDFENHFNKTFSPRAFSMVYMSQPEREKMWNSMDDKEQARVRDAYNEAKAKGYIKVGPNTRAPSP
jgi:hypothetical protein